MNIQTLSIVVPTKGCVNKCKFCVSRMHENSYLDMQAPLLVQKRIKWAVMNNINTCIITGTGEALQNPRFLRDLAIIFEKMDNPIPNIELQTSGVMLMDYEERVHEHSGEVYKYPYNFALLQEMGVSTISLSVSDIFSDENNQKIIGIPEKLKFNLSDLCREIKGFGVNLRLSLNLTNSYDGISPKKIFDRALELGADQITFRKLYASDGLETEQSRWVQENRCKYQTFDNINDFIVGGKISYGKGGMKKYKGEGTPLYRLPFGAMVYSIMGMSTVIDDNCMSKNENGSLKYVILRENGKLYSQWDDKGSLIF